MLGPAKFFLGRLLDLLTNIKLGLKSFMTSGPEVFFSPVAGLDEADEENPFKDGQHGSAEVIEHHPEPDLGRQREVEGSAGSYEGRHYQGQDHPFQHPKE